MKEFDYVRAWNEVAKPLFDRLPPDVIVAYAHVYEHYRDIHQAADLQVPFAVEGTRELFDRIPTDQLALASRVIYFYGHWRPGGVEPRHWFEQVNHGQTWKFSNLADQILTERVGIPRNANEKSGMGFLLIEGVIRCWSSSHWHWMWDEVCYATEENARFLLHDVANRPVRTGVGRASWDAFGDAVKAYALEKRDELLLRKGKTHRLIETEEFMVDKTVSI